MQSVTVLDNGCLCCSLRDDLVLAIRDLEKTGRILGEIISFPYLFPMEIDTIENIYIYTYTIEIYIYIYEYHDFPYENWMFRTCPMFLPYEIDINGMYIPYIIPSCKIFPEKIHIILFAQNPHFMRVYV